MEQVGVKDNYRLVQNLKSAGCFIVCILLTLVCLVPLYLMIVNAAVAGIFDSGQQLC